MSAVLPSMSSVSSAETIGDPEATRRVYTTVVIFVVLGVVMLVLAIWLFRRTRPEMRLLAPLEVMDTRRWRRSEPAQRGRELDEKRPPGARPLRRTAERPLMDTEFDTAQPVRSFDDLAPDAEQTYTLPDAPTPASTSSHDAADPTPTDDDAIDMVPLTPVDSIDVSDPDHPDHSEDESTAEQPLLDTVSDDPSDHDHEPDHEPAAAAGADVDGVVEPMMPGEGQTRRSSDHSP